MVISRIWRRLVPAMAVLPSVALLWGCGLAVDDPDVFPVRFVNDLPFVATVALCNSDSSRRCEHPAIARTVKPGTSRLVNIAADVSTEWAVIDTRGRLRRCVLLYFEHKPAGSAPVMRMSNAPRWTFPCAGHAPTE